MSSEHGWPQPTVGSAQRFVHTPGRRVPRRDRDVSYAPAIPACIATATLTVPTDVQLDLDAATAALASLDTATTPAAAVQLLRSESSWSSKIEQIEVKQRYVGRALGGIPTRQRAAREVAANIRAVQTALDAAPAPLTPADIDHVHEVLLPDEDWSGAPRTVQNWVGGSDHSPRDARYVPPPAALLPRLIADLIHYLNRDDVPTVVQAAIAQAQFESIHPYPDGNGRVGRALSHYVLRRRGLVTRGVAPTSLALLARRDDYLRAMSAYDDGDPLPFVRLYAESCTQSAAAARRLAAELALMESEWRATAVVSGARADAVVHRVVGGLTAQPVTTVDQTAQAYGVSRPAARNALDSLASEGVLNTTTAAKNLRIYEAVDVFAAIEDLERDLSRELDARSDG